MSDNDNSVTFVNFDFAQKMPEEILKISEDGFWVRGVKVPQDENEAEIVYRTFKEFLVLGTLTR